MPFAPVKGTQLQPGMLIYKEPSNQSRFIEGILPEYTGECNSGIHFGNSCYAWISKWWIRVPERKEAE